MPPIPTNFQIPYILRLALVLISVTLLVCWMYVLGSIIMLLLISIFLSMAMFPLTQFLANRGLSKVFSISLSILTFATVLIAFFVLLGYQFNEFFQMLPQITKKLDAVLHDCQLWIYHSMKITPNAQITKFHQYTDGMKQSGGGIVGSAVSTTGSMLGNLFILPVFVFFILYYQDMLKEFLFKVFHSTSKTKLRNLFNKIYDVIHKYISGFLLVTIIVGLLNSFGLLLLGIQSAFFFGFLAAFLLIIPYFGIIIGSILPIFVALATKDSPMYAGGVLGIFMFVQILEGNFITPYVVGSKININPLAAITSLILCEMLWGIAGMAIALPLTAILKVIFDDVEYLKPYGFLLGEPTLKKPPVKKKMTLKNIEEDIIETITETADDVKAIFVKKKVSRKNA